MHEFDREGRAVVSWALAPPDDGPARVARRQFARLDDALRHVMSAMPPTDREGAWIICASGHRLDYREIADRFERPVEPATGSAYAI